jgi:hypothetical protein
MKTRRFIYAYAIPYITIYICICIAPVICNHTAYTVSHLISRDEQIQPLVVEHVILADAPNFNIPLSRGRHRHGVLLVRWVVDYFNTCYEVVS